MADRVGRLRLSRKLRKEQIVQVLATARESYYDFELSARDIAYVLDLNAVHHIRQMCWELWEENRICATSRAHRGIVPVSWRFSLPGENELPF